MNWWVTSKRKRGKNHQRQQRILSRWIVTEVWREQMEIRRCRPLRRKEMERDRKTLCSSEWGSLLAPQRERGSRGTQAVSSGGGCLLSDWQVDFYTIDSAVTEKLPLLHHMSLFYWKHVRPNCPRHTKNECKLAPDVHTDLCTFKLSLTLYWRCFPAWISMRKDLYNHSSVSSLALDPWRVKRERSGSSSRWLEWRQWDRAAGKILKGRCGCSNVLTNSRKFPLNPVCWVFCACGKLRRRSGGKRSKEE